MNQRIGAVNDKTASDYSYLIRGTTNLAAKSQKTKIMDKQLSNSSSKNLQDL